MAQPTKKAASARGTTKKAVTKKAATSKAPAKGSGSKEGVTKSTAAKAETKKAPAKKVSTPSSAGGRASSPFPKAFLASQREALLEERATYLGQAESLKAEADSLVDDVDPGDVQFDEESGEGDSLAIERDRDLALSAQARQAVEEIDHALAKFDLGTYGICEISGEPIPEERLEAIPWARERVEHKIGGLGRR